MKNLNPAIFLFLILFVSGCKQESNDVTYRGYKLVRHISNQTAQPLAGEYAYFHINLRHKDSIINTSYGSDQIPRLRIPAQDEFNRETPIYVDALALMAKGDSATLYCPIDSLGQVPPAFADMDILEFDLKMLDIKTDAEYQEEMQVALDDRQREMEESRARKDEISEFAAKALDDYKKGAYPDMIKTPSGLEYVIHKDGTGTVPKSGQMVSVHYYGTYMDGKVFDTSFEQGEPYRFPLGQGRVIKAWDEGIGYLKPGSMASLFVPPELAYGETGYMGIPGNTPLYFLVELN